MAIEYAWRYAHEYDLVWWIPADQSVLVRSSLASMAPHLNLPPATAAGIEDAAMAVLNALRQGVPYDRWLLIFDNADQPDQINEIIPRGGGHVLITSRNQRWEQAVTTERIDVFSRQESLEFLDKRLLPRGVDPQEGDQLAEELGDLPLALEQSAALQAETGMSIPEYLVLLRKQTTQLLAEGTPLEYPVSMTAAWSLSVTQLKLRLPAAVDLLRCCSFLGPEPIPRDVFVSLEIEDDAAAGDDPHARVAVDPGLLSLLNNLIMLSTAIRELGRYALARIDRDSRTIQVHRLVQALMRDELDKEDRQRTRHVAHLLLANCRRGRPDIRQNWARYDELLVHAGPSKIVSCPFPAVRLFCLDVARYLYISGNAQAAKSFIDDVLEAWRRRASDGDELLILEAQRHLGIILRELGDYQGALSLNKRTLEAMQQLLDPNDEQILLLTNSYGADLRTQGSFAEALEHDMDSLRRHTVVFGEADRRTLRCANNLALDYGLISNYQEAQKLHEETLRLQRRAASESSSQETLSSWNGLARTVRLMGGYSDARDLGEDALAYGLQELGTGHPWLLRTAKDLSIAKRMSGDTDEGLRLAQESYDETLGICGEDHPDTLAAAMNLANALRMTGNAEQGLRLAEETMDTYPRIYGPDHPHCHGCRVNLALLKRARGDTEGARDLDQLSLDALTRTVGRDHHMTLTCALNLATDLAELREFTAARELGQDALGRLQNLLGEHHPLTIACAANLAQDLRAEGRGAEADALAEETTRRYHETSGQDHPDYEAFMDGRRLEFDFDPPPL